MRWLIVVLLVSCGKAKPSTPHPEFIDIVRDFADRTCACETDRECVRAIRDGQWEPRKRELLDHGLTGEPYNAFEAQMTRFQLCGDGAGLAIHR